MALQRMHRHAGGTKAWVHLYHDGRPLGPESHLHHLMTVRECIAPKQKVCYPDMCIYILHFPALNFSILIHMIRIACAIQILFPRCCLMKVHLQVNTLSAAWYGSWQPFCRWQLPVEWTWQQRRELTEGNGIFEYYHYLQLVDTSKYILKCIIVCIIKEQCSNKGECTWIAQNSWPRTIIDIHVHSPLFNITDTPGAKWASTESQRLLVP